jgi:hypothetical protein
VSNYTQSTNFATKDALSPGDPLKIVRGTEINTEFVNIAVAVATKLDITGLASPGPIGATTPSSFNGTTGTFSGAVSGTTGTFSGAVSGTTGTFSGNVQMTSLNGGAIALRNKIINGSFTVNQRGITTVTPASGDYTLDRWFAVQTVAGKFSVATGAANVAAVAAGVFGSLVTITSLSTYSVGASEAYSFGQRIEGYNIADLLWGSPNAKTVTLSFYVNSTLIGTFGGALKNSANTRSYPFSYSIPVANTWTRISIIITGDTTAALTDWLTTNGIGLSVIFGLGVGATLSGTAGAWAAANYSSATSAVSVVGTNGATWTLANVQLEASPVATPFEQRSIALETLLAQRYYYRLTPGVANKTLSTAPCIVLSAVSATGSTQFPVSMRATPSDLDQSGTANQYSVISVANTTCTAVPILNANLTTADFGGVTFTTTGATAGTGTLRTDATNGATAFLGWSAEL